MAEIYDKAVEFRDALLKRERRAASILVRSYGQSWNKIQKLLARVTAQIDDAQRRGLPISPAWLFQQERYQQLILQIEREITKFTHVLDAQIQKEQSAAIRAAARNTAELAAAAQTPGTVTAGFTKLSPAAIESITAFVQEQTPLGRLLAELPRGAGKAVADALTEAVALGYNPVKTARIIRREMGMTLTRALTIARTETLRAYREATHRSYQANDDIVQGWIWVASMSRRTCCSCLALHGQWFPMTERQSSHPRCRCASIPALKGDANPITESGETWLKRQPEDIQRTVIGTKAGFERFKQGELTLQDFVGLQRSPQWGDSYVQLSVKRALNGEARFPKFTPPTGAPIVAPKPPFSKRAKPDLVAILPNTGAPMVIADLKTALRSAGMPVGKIDSFILDRANIPYRKDFDYTAADALALLRHDFPAILTDAEKLGMVRDPSGNWYVGAALRNPQAYRAKK